MIILVLHICCNSINFELKRIISYSRLYISFRITNDFFMNRENSIHCINRHLYNVLLSELRTLETKCNRITAEVSEVKKMIALLPPDIGTLISSIERSAKEMHEQSIMHRKYVERCINGEPKIHLIRRADNGL